MTRFNMFCANPEQMGRRGRRPLPERYISFVQFVDGCVAAISPKDKLPRNEADEVKGEKDDDEIKTKDGEKFSVFCFEIIYPQRIQARKGVAR
jgi:hypothetical protein